MTGVAALHINVRHARHSRITHVPDKPIQPFRFREQRICLGSAVVFFVLLISFRRECAHEIAVRIFDLQRDLIFLLHLRQLVVDDNSRRGIHAAVAIRAGELFARVVQFARAVDEISVGRSINAESRRFILELPQHT